MSEKYKILAGMLSLKRFTAEALARFSEVNLNTVKSEIARSKHILKEVPATEGKKVRGGQRITFELSPKNAEGVRAEVKSMFAKLQQAVGELPAHPVRIEEVRPPMALLAAEDALTRARDGSDPNRGHWLEQTNLHLLAVRQELKAMSVNPARRGHEEILAPRVRVVELELKFLELERMPIAVPALADASSTAEAEPVCLVSTVDSDWANELRDSLRPLVIEIALHGPGQSVQKKLHRTAQWSNATRCIVTMDSRNANEACRKLADDLMASCSPAQRLLFLDDGFDRDFRKHVMARGMLYCDHAADLRAGEIRGVFEREHLAAAYLAKAARSGQAGYQAAAFLP